MNCTVSMVNCNSIIHAICSLSFMMYKYSELQVSCATQKLNYKVRCKTPFFLTMLFVVHSIIPQAYMLKEFLHIWESIEDGWVRVIICGEKITVDQALITQQFGVSVEGAIDVANTLVKEAQFAFKNIARLDAFVNKE
jgi:ABC-type arginine/histidine transport system permease subunit